MSVTHSSASSSRVRWLYPLSIATAVAILVAWFPFGTLLRQQGELAATARQVAVVQAEQQALRARQRSATSKTQAIMLARQLYQLVSPGQSLIQVLPGTATGSSPGSGDPGNQPLVSPSSSPAPTPAGGSVHSTASGWRGFLSRLVRTLEFWR